MKILCEDYITSFDKKYCVYYQNCWVVYTLRSFTLCGRLHFAVVYTLRSFTLCGRGRLNFQIEYQRRIIRQVTIIIPRCIYTHLISIIQRQCTRNIC